LSNTCLAKIDTKKVQMELRHLRYFVMVAEELHFGRAAQRLHITQQPLSRQIQSLEEELGVQLLHRTKRTVRLTELGQLFLVEARKILTQTEQAVQLVQQINRGDRGHLTVGFTGPALNTVLPEVVRQFREYYPNVRLTLQRMLTHEQVDSLKSGSIDVGLLHAPIEDDALVLQTIHRESLVVMLPSTHSLAIAPLEPLSIAQLANEPFILFPRYVWIDLYDEIISFCRQAGFSPNIVQEALPQETIVELVEIGIGVTLIHASAQRIAQVGVVCRPSIEHAPQIEVAIAWHAEASNPILPKFVEIIRAVAGTLSTTAAEENGSHNDEA
jgi:DNA-binding transcriptional LysR family regulator